MKRALLLASALGCSPAIYELDSPRAHDACTSERVSVSRPSAATYFDATGALRTAGADEPRCAHTLEGERLGLLVEGASENLLRNSVGAGADVVPAPWDPETTGPVTLTFAAREDERFPGHRAFDVTVMNPGSTLGHARVFLTDDRREYPTAAGIAHSACVFVRRVGDAPIIDGGIGLHAFDAAGSYIEEDGTSFESIGDDWARVCHSRTSGAGEAFVVPRLTFYAIPAGAPAFTVRLVAPQLERAATPSSYIATGASSTSRAADTVAVTLEHAVGPAEGAWVVSALVEEVGPRPLLTALDADGAARLSVALDADTGATRWSIPGTPSWSLVGATAWTRLEPRSVGLTYGDGEALAGEGGALLAPTPAPRSSGRATRVLLGADAPAGARLDGYVRAFLTWPRRLSADDLAAATLEGP